MKWKNVLLPAVTVFAAAGVLYHTLAPKGAVFSPGPVPAAENWALLPLDNRPPCRDFTEELGALGGIHFTAPPSEIMDWYDEPAHIPALKTWLAGTLPRQQGALLSTDLMIFGGLLHSRMEPLTDRKAGDFFTWLEELKDDNPDKQFYLYSIIPRLLISDHVLPDRWYQWHLMTWTINMDKKIRGLPYDRENYEEVKALIPMDLKWKYITLYRDNDRFNEELVQFVTEENLTDLVIGQDDAHPYGLPNYNRLNAGAYPQAYDLHPPIYTSQGADELGALAAARIYSRRTGYRPRIRVLYGDPAMKDYTLHFVPLTLGQIAEEKIRLANGTETVSLEDADFVLYIHCGGEKAEDSTRIARDIKELMEKKPVALVDLSTRFAAGDCILPHLMANGTPLPRLLAYSGWNTASNAIGTAVAQGTIVSGQAQKLPRDQLPALYSANFQFNYARFLDDWAYQKLIRPHMAELQDLNGVAPEKGGDYPNAATCYLSRELGIYHQVLLWYCRQFPYYEDGENRYWFRDAQFAVNLPWERPFEIRLKIFPEFGKEQLTKGQ